MKRTKNTFWMRNEQIRPKTSVRWGRERVGWGVGWTSCAIYLFCDSGHMRNCGFGGKIRDWETEVLGSSSESAASSLPVELHLEHAIWMWRLYIV